MRFTVTSSVSLFEWERGILIEGRFGLYRRVLNGGLVVQFALEANVAAFCHRLEMMLNTLLSMLQETSLWEDDVPVVLIIETILQTQVQIMQAENGEFPKLQRAYLTSLDTL